MLDQEHGDTPRGPLLLKEAEPITTLIEVVVPPHLKPQYFPLQPADDFEKRARQEQLVRGSLVSGVSLDEVEFGTRRGTSLRLLAGQVHPEAMIDRLLKESAALKGNEAVLLVPDERGVIQRQSALEVFAAAATAVQAISLLGEKFVVIAAVRPSGHHAGREMAGYCCLNNLALAVRDYLNQHPKASVSILDLDPHFGHGTAEIIVDGKLPNCRYFSLGFDRIYQSDHPLTGSTNPKIRFARLTPGITEADYLEELKRYLKLALQNRPEVLAVSLGFDTDPRDSVTRFELGGKPISHLKPQAFHTIGSLIAQLAAENQTRVFVCTEGGYNLRAIAEDLRYFIEGTKEGLKKGLAIPI